MQDFGFPILVLPKKFSQLIYWTVGPMPEDSNAQKRLHVWPYCIIFFYAIFSLNLLDLLIRIETSLVSGQAEL